jgi:hypothetical protein
MKRLVKVLLIVAILILLVMCVLSLMEGQLINPDENTTFQELFEP